MGIAPQPHPEPQLDTVVGVGVLVVCAADGGVLAAGDSRRVEARAEQAR